MMHYITKVDDLHIVSLNGKNVKVREELTSFAVYYPHDSTSVSDKITITPAAAYAVYCTNAKPFTAILVAVELVKFIKEQTK